MSGCNVWEQGKVWGRHTEDGSEEPIVSLVEIMSEELAHTLNEEEERKESDILQAIQLSESLPLFDNDEVFAKELQRQFDREYDLSVRLEEEKKKGNKTVLMTPDRYCPRSHQDSDDDDSSDDDATREAATALLYEKLSSESPLSSRLGSTSDAVSKHDAIVAARRNADKTLNDNVNLSVGDMISEKISNKVYNSLRSFSKADAKRQMRLKDKEEMATMDTSVDSATRLILFKWINQEIFDKVEGVVATGKESAVLHALHAQDEHFAIKVYKTSLTEFKNRSEYVKDDFRFKNAKKVLKIWAEREFMNLKRMHKHDLPCPIPIRVKKHLLIMSFIGEKSMAAPRLHNVDFGFFTEEEKLDIYLQVQSIMCRMFKLCHLVHADLSEFNLLYCYGKVHVIDVSQAMDISHPRHLFYLIRDIENVLSFFENVGVASLPTAVKLFNMITDLEMVEGDNLLVQVEAFSEDNRCTTLRADKSKPADMDLRLYNAEKSSRTASPARDYN